MRDLVRACERLLAAATEYREMGRDLPLRGASDATSEIARVLEVMRASVVPAPECLVCGSPLEAHLDRDWVCRDTSCDAEGFVVEAHLTGVFPVKLSP